MPPFSGSLEFTPKRVMPRVEPFPMSQVHLLPDTVFHDAQEWNRGYMARLAPERLLYTFRVNAGLPVGSATPLGGWEQPENGKRSSELRGHFVGHFLSASALLYASTGATDVKSRADFMVAELAKCQQRLGGTYLSAFPTSWWDRLESGQRVWAPFYTIHKIMAGMFDMYRLAGNRQALQVLEGMAAWVDAWTASKTEERFNYYERLLLNHRIGTIRPNIGTTQYYLSLTPGVWKTFNTEDQTFWCCTGTGIEEYAKLTDSIYWRDDEGVYVNLFIASELDLQEERFKLRQDTTYPESEHTALMVAEAGPRPLRIRVRVPGWLHSSPVVKLNGNPLDASATPGSYLTLTRLWKAGDRVDMDLPMHLHMRQCQTTLERRRFSTGRWCWPAISATTASPKHTSSDRICALEQPASNNMARPSDRSTEPRRFRTSRFRPFALPGPIRARGSEPATNHASFAPSAKRRT